jgi:hypothetical protein
VPDHREPLPPERVGQAEHVVGEGTDRVGRDASRLVGQAVAALVGRRDPQPGGRERAYLPPPAAGGLREAVQQDDQRPVRRAGDDRVQLDAVRPQPDGLRARDAVGLGHRWSRHAPDFQMGPDRRLGETAPASIAAASAMP